MKKKSGFRGWVPPIWVKKCYRIMRLTMLFFILGLIQVSASVYSQNTKLNLDLRNTRVVDVLEAIESQSEFRFAYSSEYIDMNRKVDMKVNEKSIEQTLSVLFNGTNVKYSISDRHIMLFLDGLSNIQSQQQKTVSGKVSDSTGNGLPGVSVAIKGKATGTITDVDGNFKLASVPENASLQFSFVGMKSQEISVAGKTTINVTLVEESVGIDEVVAIGYGVVKKSNLTSSISKVTNEAIKERPITLLSEAFQGQLAGVRSQASNGGVPGEELTIRIRGLNTINGDSSPLYVIDGTPRDNMNDINPSDIASIQILKDASATAIYGSRGANGVVLIDTKKGTGKPSISFDAYYGWQTKEKTLDLMSGPEWVSYNTYYRNLSYLRLGGSMSDPMSARTAANQIPTWWATTTDFTDWQNAVLQTAPMQNYQVSASSKGDMGNLYFSAGYMDQDGIILNTYYKRMNARLNGSMNVNEKTRLGINMSMAHSDKDTRGTTLDGGKESPIHHALMITPLMKLTEGTRDWGTPSSNDVGSTYPNPVEQLKYTTDNTKYLRATVSLWGEYDIMKALTFKTQYSYNHDGYTYEFYQPGNVTYNNGYVTKGNSKATTTGDWVVQNTLTYDKSFNKHHLNALIGQSAEKQMYYEVYAEATGWPYETIETLNKATTAVSASTKRTTYSNASFFGRLSYDFKEKYLFTASARYDGSSRFGSNQKWGLFPSFSAGWKVNEESFLKLVDWISLLKLRASWGKSGNDRIGDYKYIALLSAYNASWGNSLVSGVAASNIANNDLQWESTNSLDFGIDFSALKNRIQLNVDYYVNTTDNLLFSAPIPFTTGFSSYTTNIGKIRNKGIEIDVTSRNIASGPFKWETNLNLSRNVNKVLELGSSDYFTETSYDGQFITKVGGPISQFYIYRTDGFLMPSDFDSNGKALVPIFAGQEEGNYKYVDQDHNGTLNSLDLVPYGNNLPDVIYGLTNRFSWKNFELSVLIQGQIGGDVMYLGQRHNDNGTSGRRIFSRWLRAYKPDYEKLYGTGPIPTAYNTEHGIDTSWDGKTPNPFGNNPSNCDRRIYDATYMRIKNITLSYTLPKNLLHTKMLSSVKFYASLDNVKTFTDYPGYTPETSSFGNGTTRLGVDYSTYPLSRKCTLGVNIVF